MLSTVLSQQEWRFHRTIEDHLSSIQQTATGAAIWRGDPKDANTLWYSETGCLTLNQKDYDFSKEYRYVFSDHCCDIFFSDGVDNGKLFLHFLMNGSEATATHLCRQDRYQARIQFPTETRSQLILSYEVKGPKKDYHMVTSYRPNC
ncbi:MAG: hypothetical protein A3E84_04100 [Gammaproteobacteria bacterium RIFCSPHIGHO2_12_FULL_42_13]|nr:MAG: hypothetical protein A3E84_04100 [Gammaproteobacteria bacterium RIFCSPHIGHO2_12_FULL_42_13]